MASAEEIKAAFERGEARAEAWRRERQLVLYAAAILQGKVANYGSGINLKEVWNLAERMYEEEKRRFASAARPASTAGAWTTGRCSCVGVKNGGT